MASRQQESPAATMDHSPAESFLSAPGDGLPSLFAAPSPSSTINPQDMMTPPSDDRSATPSGPSPSPDLGTVPEDSSTSSNPSTEKKPAKKRKSWGQVLPEPKTNLPPRKRAKTEDEKEQRRVERVLRNRRAAQSSRERKRLEVEALEQRNKELEEQLATMQKTNYALLEALQRHSRDSGLGPLADTLSAQLFGSQAAHGLDSTSLDKLQPPTVNPASLSPKAEEQEPEVKVETQAQPSELTSAAPSDMTQRPAAMLCDLQCQTSEQASLPSASQSWAWTSFLMTMISTSILSACQRPLVQIAMSLKAGFSILPSPPILTTIIWLVTQPARSRPTSTSTTGSATIRTPCRTFSQRAKIPLLTTSASSPMVSTLRVKFLRKILSSSPNLARPLVDATFEALRLVSEGHDDRAEIRTGLGMSQEVNAQLRNCLRRVDLPSREVLLALLWTLKVEQRKMAKSEGDDGSVSSRPESGDTQNSHPPNATSCQNPTVLA